MRPTSGAARAARIAATIRRGDIGECNSSTPERPQRIVDRVGDRRRRRDGAAFADALDAEHRVGRGRFHVIEPRLGDFGRTGQQIIGERRRQRLSGAVERHFLVERGADALRQAAIDLAVDDHRIDQHAAVLDDDIVEQLDVAEIGIDRDGDGVGGIGEGAAVALRLVAGSDFQPAWIDIDGQILRPPVPGMGDVRERDAAVGAADPAVAQADQRPDRAAAVWRRSSWRARRVRGRRSRPRRRPSPSTASPRCRSSRASARCRRAPHAPWRCRCRESRRRSARAWSRDPGRGSGRRPGFQGRHRASSAHGPAHVPAPSECPSRHRPRCRARPARNRSRGRCRSAGHPAPWRAAAPARPATSIAASARRRACG